MIALGCMARRDKVYVVNDAVECAASMDAAADRAAPLSGFNSFGLAGTVW